MLAQRMPSALFELYSIQCFFNHGRYDCMIWFDLHAGHFSGKTLENDPSMSQRLEFYLSTCSRRHHSCHSRLYQNHSESMYITTVSSEVHTSHRISHNSTSMEFSRPCLQVWVLDQYRSGQNRFYKLRRIMIKMAFVYLGQEELGQVNVPSAGASTAW